MFKGYIPTKGKKPLEEYKNRTEFYSYKYMTHCNSDYGGILDDNLIQIDIDDTDKSELLYKIIQENNIQCSMLKTERGRHFYFINPGISRRKQGYYTPIGIKIDVGLGSQNAVIPLKVNGKTRRLIECDNPQELPKWLYPLSKTSIDFSNMTEGDGRNQTLFNYILTLQGSGMGIPDIKETIKIINKYILQQPLPEREIDTILRDEAFMKQSFYIKGKLQYEELAKYLIENENVIKINNQLHIYKDGVYTNNLNEIEKSMLKYINNSTKNIRSEVIKYLELLAPEQVQASSNLIALGNGIFNIATKLLQDFNPKIIIKNKVPWDYNSSIYDKTVDDILDKITCNDKELRLLLEEMTGYTLFRTSELTKSFFLTGDGSNGKSTFLDMIKMLLGDNNYSALGLEDFKYQFRLAEMDGKLANIGDDIDKEYLKSNAIFKKIVAGNDLVIEKKGKDPISKVITAKLIFSANEMPRMNDLSFGGKRRLVIIPFNAVFKKTDKDFDPFIKDKVKTNQAMEYFLKLALQGLERIVMNKGFTGSKISDKELENYDRINNPILSFIEENKIENESTTDIFKQYQLWCVDNGYESTNKINFSRRICKAGFNTNQIKQEGKVIRIFKKVTDSNR